MIGTAELIVVFLVALLLFGGKRLPELAKSLGKGLKEFKQAYQGITDDLIIDPTKTENQNVKTIPIDVLQETPSRDHEPKL